MNPKLGGKNGIIFFLLNSMDGIINDQIEEAIIIPDDNPINTLSYFLFILFFIKNTNDAPNVVPMKGNNKINILKKQWILKH